MLELTPFPVPGDIVDQIVEELVEVYRQSEGLKSPQKPKIRKLLEAANNSIGVIEGQQMARLEMATLVRRYRQLE